MFGIKTVKIAKKDQGVMSTPGMAQHPKNRPSKDCIGRELGRRKAIMMTHLH